MRLCHKLNIRVLVYKRYGALHHLSRKCESFHKVSYARAIAHYARDINNRLMLVRSETMQEPCQS